MSAMDSDHENKQRRSCGSDGSACSPSSLTPQTDAKQKLKDIIGEEYVTADFARSLERELRKTAEVAGDLASDLQRLRSAVRNLRDVKGRHNSQIAMERLMAILPENRELSP